MDKQYMAVALTDVSGRKVLLFAEEADVSGDMVVLDAEVEIPWSRSSAAWQYGGELYSGIQFYPADPAEARP